MKNKEFSLERKRIIVTGGGGLLGSKICTALCDEGAYCTIADRENKAAEKLVSEITVRGNGRALFAETEINDKASVDTMIRLADYSFGGIDGLINAAYPRNQHYGRKFEEVEYSDFCENVSLHLGGYFLVSQRILEYFRLNNGGTLLNISSIYGVIAPRFEVYNNTVMTMPVEYAAIKAALIHLTRYMAKYYAGNNIRVNSISLGGLRDRQPESFLVAYMRHCLDKGMLDPSDIIGTVLYLMSDGSRYVNGQNLVVDDGFTL